MMQFDISYKIREVHHAILCNAETAEQAQAYFESIKPNAIVVGANVCNEGYRPGKPCITVPNDWVAIEEIEEVVNLSNTTTENQVHCKHIVDTLKQISEGNVYECPKCSELSPRVINTIKLKFLGGNYLGYPIYSGEDNTLWADVEKLSTQLSEGECVDKSALKIIIDNAISLKSNASMSNIKKYQNLDIELCFDTITKPSEYLDTYMMLGRLKSDCDNYLYKYINFGYGGWRLWGITVERHIEEMKQLYNSLPLFKKPLWLTWEQIEEYNKNINEIEEVE